MLPQLVHLLRLPALVGEGLSLRIPTAVRTNL